MTDNSNVIAFPVVPRRHAAPSPEQRITALADDLLAALGADLASAMLLREGYRLLRQTTVPTDTYGIAGMAVGVHGWDLGTISKL